MIIEKYLKQISPKWKVKKLGGRDSNNDDMIDKNFYLVNSTLSVDAELSNMDSVEFLTVETYQLFLKDYDAIKFIAKLKKIFPAAKTDGICLIENNSAINVSIDRQEQGYLIDLIFNIQGV